MTVIINGATGETTPGTTFTGSTSGTILVQAASVAGTNTITLPAVTGTVLASSSGTITVPSGSGTAAVQGLSTNIVQGTSQASTSGTAITFTGIPSWAKRITLMINGVTTSGTSFTQIQLGTSGGFTTSGYVSPMLGYNNGGGSWQTASTGFAFNAGGLNTATSGQMVITNLNSNIWTMMGMLGWNGQLAITTGGISLASTLTQIRFTTVNGTDTFTAGSINILYE